MKKILLYGSCLMLLAAAPNDFASAAVSGNLENSFSNSGEVLDTAFSGNGKMFFVLNRSGELLVYSPAGKLLNTIKTDGKADLIAASPAADKVFLTDTDNNMTQVMAIETTFDIQTEGLPTKGPANAPVVVAIFSDFQ